MMFFIKKKKKPETNLPHWGDSKIWIENCIDSCKTGKQISSTFNLILLYEKQYKGQFDYVFLGNITKDLHNKRNDKWGEILKKDLNNKQNQH